MCRYYTVLYQFYLYVLALNFELNYVSANCDLFEWRCDNGGCIPYEDRCDGINQCTDGSDETAEHCIQFTCPVYAFRCAYGACIPSSVLCDMHKDCADGSDETRFLCDRSLNESKVVEILRGNCSNVNTFECQAGECIHIDKRCDGILDCSNGADETVEMCSSLPCHQISFRCGYGACIAGNLRCNGVNDCFDGSDETLEMCQPTESSSSFCRMPLKRDYLEFFNVNGKKLINAGDVVDYGIELRFKCTQGWHLLGARRIFCERNGWSNPVPYCTQFCSKYLANRGISTIPYCLHNDQEIHCDRNIPIGGIVQHSCAPGYTLDERAPKPLNQAIRCNSDGKWNADKLKCTPDCGILKNSSTEELPWEVSIFRIQGTLFRKQCAGIIISPKIVISAEKCFTQILSTKPDDHELYNIVEGNFADDYKPNANLMRGVFNVSEITLTSSLHSSEHIAILVLVKYFDFSKNLAPACVQLKRFTTSPYLPGELEKSTTVASTAFGGGFYTIQQSIYFLSAVVSDRITLKPINITNFDSILKKYIERYYNLL